MLYNNEDHIDDVYNEITKNKELSKHIENLFLFLDNSINIDEIKENIKYDFNNVKENGIKRINELRGYYDWDSLKKIISICPGIKSDLPKIELQDLFNIIDMNLKNSEGFYVNGTFLSVLDIIKSKNMLIMIMMLVHSVNYYCNVLNNKK